MKSSSNQDEISKYLGIRPINHGEIFTFQLAIPESEKLDFSTERLEVIRQSLNEHKSNLVPLIVRRTDAYDDEKEYEIIYGADWYIVAEELEIERLWAWVFELSDKQAFELKNEMKQLTIELFDPTTDNSQNNFNSMDQINTEFIENNDLQKVELILQKFESNIENFLQRKIDELLMNKLNDILIKLDQNKNITSGDEFIKNMMQTLEVKLDQINNSINQFKSSLDSKSSLNIPITAGDEKTNVTQIDYENKTCTNLKELAKKRKLKGYSSLKKEQLIELHRNYDKKSV